MGDGQRHPGSGSVTYVRTSSHLYGNFLANRRDSNRVWAITESSSERWVMLRTTTSPAVEEFDPNFKEYPLRMLRTPRQESFKTACSSTRLVQRALGLSASKMACFSLGLVLSALLFPAIAAAQETNSTSKPHSASLRSLLLNCANLLLRSPNEDWNPPVPHLRAPRRLWSRRSSADARTPNAPRPLPHLQRQRHGSFPG